MAWKNTDLGSGINIPDLHHRKKYTLKVLEHEPEMERNKKKYYIFFSVPIIRIFAVKFP
jgi:hypothetical protein